MKSMDYDELVENYGMDYIVEQNPDSAIYSMDEFDDILNGTEPYEVARLTFYGTRYGYKNDGFNPNDEYFTFNGYGNLESVTEYDLGEYINDHIDDSDAFIEWCVDNGFIEEGDVE